MVPIYTMAFYKKSSFDSDIEIPAKLIEERRARLAELLYVDVSVLIPGEGEIDAVGEMLILAEEVRLKKEKEIRRNGG